MDASPDCALSFDCKLRIPRGYALGILCICVDSEVYLMV